MAETVNPCDCEPMQIKTVIRLVSHAGEFDREVNKALTDGWILKKRYLSTPIGQPETLVTGQRFFIAELVKNEPDPEPEKSIFGDIRSSDAMRQIENFFVMMKNLSDIEARD